MGKKPRRTPAAKRAVPQPPGEPPSRRDAKIAQLRNDVEALRQQLHKSRNERSRIELLTHKLEKKNARIRKELDVAREFQRRLIPADVPQVEGVRIVAHHVSAARVGGEVYDIFGIGNSCLGVFIGNGSGRGLPAAFVMTMAKLSLHTASVNEYSPKAVLDKVNQDLCCSVLESQFMAAFFGILDLETNRLKYVNASHSPPMLLSGGRLETLDTEGMFCGMFEEPRYEEKQRQLSVGDRILLYSDGAVKTPDATGKPFGIERLRRLVKSAREREMPDFIQTVVGEVTAHLAESPAETDLAFVGVEIVPHEVRDRRAAIPSDPKLLQKIEDAIMEDLTRNNYGERAQFGVRLAVEEAVINAMKHGNRMDKAKQVTVTWSVGEDEAVISVEDEGEGFDPAAVPDPTLEENLEVPHGRGLVLIRAYMDRVEFNDKGNLITLVKRAPWRD